MQEVQVVLTEVWGNATADVMPSEAYGCALVPRGVPGVTPPVAVLVLEVVGLPGERRHDHGDPMLAEVRRSDDQRCITDAAVVGCQADEIDTARPVSDRQVDRVWRVRIAPGQSD